MRELQEVRAKTDEPSRESDKIFSDAFCPNIEREKRKKKRKNLFEEIDNNARVIMTEY